MGNEQKFYHGRKGQGRTIMGKLADRLLGKKRQD